MSFFTDQLYVSLPQIHQLDFTIYSKMVETFVSSELSNNSPISEYSGYLPDREFAILHTATPNIKMYYPEPFIATPTFVTEDIWFLHITIYQYWLWFIFISLIVFFFLGFLITLRWCNIRHRPVRETRGVSRSKCGDLITAVVPVSWAASIIIHESTDAIEFNDGFGSTDVAIGIRAYQWGWEYYYPKSLNLTNQVNNSSFIGNSVSNSWSDGVEDAFFDFKSSALHSDVTHHSATNYTAQLLSLKSDSTLNQQNLSVIGNNKLVARRAVNLLNKADILNLDTALSSPSTPIVDLADIQKNFINYEFDLTYPSKPTFTNHQVSFFTSKNAYLNALTFLNWHDLQLNLTGLKNLTATYASISNFNYELTPASNFYSYNLETLPTYGALLKETRAFQAFWNLTNYSGLNFTLLADQDFKRWSAADLLEDSYWTGDDWSAETKNLTDEFSEVQHTLDACFTSALYATQPLTLSLTNGETAYPIESTVTKVMTSPHILNSGDVYNQIKSDWLNTTVITNTFVNWKQLQTLLNQTSLNTIWSATSSNLAITMQDLVSSFSISRGLTMSPSVVSKLDNSTLNTSSDFIPMWKNLTTFSGAFWKVFKPTLDEQRGTFNASNFSNTGVNLPVVADKVPSLLSAMGKNSLNRYSDILTLRREDTIKTATGLFINNLNLEQLAAFPFNLSFESDSIRYTWFDWYSTRNSVVTKALDTSVFNLHASKDYDYNFTSSLFSMDSVNKLDNYFLKYSQARKFYLPITTYTPFFFSNQLNLLGSLSGTATVSGNVFETYLTSLLNTDTLSNLPVNLTTVNTSTRPYISSLTGKSNSIDAQTTAVDALSRREYIKASLRASVKANPLNRNFLSTKVLTTDSDIYNSIRAIAESNDAPFGNDLAKLDSVKTSQYQPLRKGIVNMIRIQADKAVAMPTDTRLQILAVSKDIIHSWSIPAAGIKIDCIPGYSSHRVAVFTLSGIYWGQCMEICGRFHHWMPIVVYFMRRDLFCLWCIHFIFKNNQTNSTLQSLDASYVDSSSRICASEGANWTYIL